MRHKIIFTNHTLSKYEEKMWNIMKEKKMAILWCVIILRAKTRAHARVRDFFIKCLKWPETYAKWIWDDFEHFKICARTDARTYAHARVFWPEIERKDIDLDHDKFEWEMAFGYEDMIMSWFSDNFTKWPLDDVISQGQSWKLFCALLYWLYICVPNFKTFDWEIFKLSCTQKSGSK